MKQQSSIFWSPSTKGFYDSDIHATMPEDVVEIGRAERERLLNGQASGSTITSDSTGRPMLAAMAAPTTTELRDMALAQARQQRAAIMSRLDGLQASAMAMMDGEKAVAIETVKQGLRDVTLTDLSGLSTAFEMQSAMAAAFTSLAASASEEVQRAFR